MKTRFTCPCCHKTLAVEVKQTTEFNVKFKKDGTQSRYEQKTENIEITEAWQINTLFNHLQKDIEPKLQKGIKVTELRNKLRNQKNMDYDMTEAFISKIKKQGAVEKNGELRYPT